MPFRREDSDGDDELIEIPLHQLSQEDTRFPTGLVGFPSRVRRFSQTQHEDIFTDLNLIKQLKRTQEKQEHYKDGDFWDVFTVDEEVDIPTEVVCYSPIEILTTSLKLLGAAVLILTTLSTLLLTQVSVITLTRPSTDKKVEHISQLALILASCMPCLCAIPVHVIGICRNGGRLKSALNFKTLILTIIQVSLEAYSFIILTTEVFPKIDCVKSILGLSIVSTLPAIVSVASQKCTTDEHKLPVLLQIGTLFVIAARSPDIAAWLVITLAAMIVSSFCARRNVTSKSFDDAIHYQGAVASIAKIAVTMILCCLHLPIGQMVGATMPEYIKMNTMILCIAPVYCVLILQALSLLRLAKVSALVFSVSTPILLIAMLILSLTSADLCLITSANGQCATTMRPMEGATMNGYLLGTLILWTWGHWSLIHRLRDEPRLEAINLATLDKYIIETLSFAAKGSSRVHHAVATPRHYPSGRPNYIRRVSTESDTTAPPLVYVCATMWHENITEMTNLIKSLARLDEYHNEKRCATLDTDSRSILDPDYFDVETHIMFDDAMTIKDGVTVLNHYAEQLIHLLDTEISGLSTPTKIPTPYGGQLVYTLPGGSKLAIHLKNKTLIRHKKRWSMVQYMYYLLGYRLMSEFPDNELRMMTAAENTFILTLDGDVYFEPASIQQLLDEILSNSKLGVVCGRIHPIGQGLMVWYQRFEYAIAHWLHKTAESVMGVVLCTPGAFSLFRASALMDKNVMKKYTEVAKTGKDILQREQGEDRWLCTLLLQQGHRCGYVPTASAQTYAPETMSEFFNQRRRWALSSIVNQLDLLISWKNSYLKNRDVSLAYVIFQALMMLSTLIGPAYVLLVIAYANMLVFHHDIDMAYTIAIVAPIFYTVLCTFTESAQQIRVAGIMAIYYGCLMLVYLVGNIQQLTENEILWSPTGLFLFFLGCLFVFAAILHPREIVDVLPGVLYYLSIPTTYMILMVYCIMNLNNVSWGTRESSSEELGSQKVDRDSLTNPSWCQGEALRGFKMSHLDGQEVSFWKRLIAIYLEPRTEEKAEQQRLQNELTRLRNKSAGFYFLLNAVTLGFCYLLQKFVNHLSIIGPSSSMEPVAVTCVVFFGLVVLAQFLCLIWQRCMKYLNSLTSIVAWFQKTKPLRRRLALQKTRTFNSAVKRHQRLLGKFSVDKLISDAHESGHRLFDV